MRYKAVLFDLDGTIIHTAQEYQHNVVRQVLDKFGKTCSDDDIARLWFASGRKETIEDCFGVDQELFWEIYSGYDTPDARIKAARLYDDVDFLGELKQEGYRTGIVTGAAAGVAYAEIGLLDRENIDAVVIAHILNGIRPKPDPHGIEECLAILGVRYDEAIYVGNSDEDVMAARNAKVLDVLIDRGEHEFPGLEPSVRIYSLYELRRYI